MRFFDPTPGLRFAVLVGFTAVAISCGEPTGPVIPATPTNVTATLVSGTSAMVTWSPNPQSDAVVSYSIFRNAVKVGESVSTSFTDTGLDQLTTYAYSVAATSKGGNASARSSETTASTIATPDITKPTVVSNQPSANFNGAPSGTTVSVTFSEPMDPASISITAFSLKTAGGPVIPSTVVYTAASRIAELRPVSALPNPAVITATVSTEAKDLAGNSLSAPFTWSFTTRDESPPTVVAVLPGNGASGISPAVAVKVTFSENMDATTINATNITARTTSGGNAVAGTVTYDGTTNSATFTPSGLLSKLTGYTVTITTAVKDAAGNQMAGTVTSAFTTTGSDTDVTPPTVVGINPTGIDPRPPVTITPSVTFSEPMDQSTINTTNFTLTNIATGAVIAGSMSYDSQTKTALFNHSAPLANSTVYTLAVSTGVKDLAGNALASPFLFGFKTEDIPDTTPPTIIARSPASGQTGVPLNANVVVTFSEPMNIFTIDEHTIKIAPTSAPGAFLNTIVVHDTAAHTATLDPNNDLAYNTSYTVTVTTGVKDVPGNPLAAPATWTFTTIPDTTPPTVTATSPSDGATGVLTTSVITVTFSESMDPATINATNFTVRDNATSTNIAGTVSYNASTSVGTFKPTSPLTPNHSYTAVLSTGVKDPGGNSLPGSVSINFTTSPDGVAPTIAATSPSDGATNVPISSVITVTFSEDMDPTTINTSTFLIFDTLFQGFFPGTVTYDPSTRVATFTPRTVLAIGRKYIGEITSFARDTAGNRFTENTTFTFTTAP